MIPPAFQQQPLRGLSDDSGKALGLWIHMPLVQRGHRQLHQPAGQLPGSTQKLLGARCSQPVAFDKVSWLGRFHLILPEPRRPKPREGHMCSGPQLHQQRWGDMNASHLHGARLQGTDVQPTQHLQCLHQTSVFSHLRDGPGYTLNGTQWVSWNHEPGKALSKTSGISVY